MRACGAPDSQWKTRRLLSGVPVPYQVLADAVLVLHAGVVLFVVGGLIIIYVGNVRGWRWVNALLFRLTHLAAIAMVVVQSWLGHACALTTVESWLRERAGQPGYSKSFLEYWLQRLMYFEAPIWVFALAYTAFGLLVLAAWRRYPPKRREP